MRDEMKKVPRLRFRGFQEDWELCKLGELIESFDSERIPIDSSLRISGQYPYYGATGIIDYIDSYIFDGEYVLLAEDGANIIMRNYPVAYLTQGKFWLNNHAHIMRMVKGDNQFLVQILEKMNYSKYNTGTAQPKLNSNIVKRINLRVPIPEEQQKIGTIFKQLDDTITLHQRKLEQLKELKKAYLQVMFPVKDEGVPKLRFADFEEEWEQCKLEDLANKYNNLRIPITASKRIYGNTPYYGANGIQDFVEGYTHDGEFILVAEDGASNLKDYPVQYVNGKVWVNNHAHVLQAKRSKADNKFLMNAIKSINIEPFLVGGGRSKLNSEVMMNLEINTPSKDEQLKISTLCKQLDDITALYQNKLNQLKNLKKSYLQNMFI
ncbi:restriction endonuclease subunit S [Enterococcus faecalis]|uniref:restriction endonuclease subunit S n=3 Tax=Enterococcus faecalis TaxID=1351 RepID=UPI00046C84CA|nr:restriction endonuclease subunit S [Enterococcus faecalis]EHB6443085.1 restriction endonuclease subunit S [Enterococcus faecalis]EHF1088637.1 restriction endonuclease subunit S [Enterococcus faecalis]